MEHLLYGHNKNKFNFDPFIYQTVKVFCKSKKKIAISMYNLDEYIDFKKFLNLIFGENDFGEIGKFSELDDESHFIPDNNQNIPNHKFLQKFKNVTSLEISGVEHYDDDGKYYSFSLIKLLSLVLDTKIEKVTIDGYVKKGSSSSWLSFSWNTQSLSLTQTFKKKGFNIQFKKERDLIGRKKHCIDISKI